MAVVAGTELAAQPTKQFFYIVALSILLRYCEQN